MAFNPQFDQIGQAFVAHYYSKFDVPDPSARSLGLTDLYDVDNSFMTFEEQQVKGRQAILEKFSSLRFQTIQHVVTKCDCQPMPDGSVMVVVIGQLKTDNDPPNSFTHCFILKPNTTGSFYVSNEIFRLILH